MKSSVVVQGLAVAALALCLTACQGGGGAAGPAPSTPSSPAAPSSSAPPTPSQSPTESLAPALLDDGEDRGEYSAPPLKSDGFPSGESSRPLKEVRFGHHDAFERVVIELGEDRAGGKAAEASYQMEYVDSVLGEGKGDPISVPGKALLQIHLAGIAYPESNDPAPFGALNPAGQVVKGLFTEAPFEGMASVVIGLDKERPVRVQTLTDPLRLVVDIPIE